jgi:hypothetical protein
MFTQSEPVPASNHVNPINVEAVAAPVPAPAPEATVHGAPARILSVDELLRHGITIHGPAEKTLVTRAADAGTTAAGVAVGIGIAYGAWALGALVVGLFTGESIDV